LPASDACHDDACHDNEYHILESFAFPPFVVAARQCIQRLRKPGGRLRRKWLPRKGDTVPEAYFKDEFFTGLRQLADSAFPKRCAHCGRVFRNSDEFLAATRPVRPDSSGLKQSRDDDGQMIVDLFRNCVCGSTLLESFQNRRNVSKDGVMRRMLFQDMVGRLVVLGYQAEAARGELLKLMRGQPNELMGLTKSNIPVPGNPENLLAQIDVPQTALPPARRR
jgi:hypothetical protein